MTIGELASKTGVAHKKQLEIDDRIAQLKAMRRVVGRVLHCECAELADCGRIAASVIEAAR